jgi:hypothetical protein
MFRSFSRSLSLAGMSKRVPQIGQAGGQVVGLAPQFRVHVGSFGEIAKPLEASLIFYRPTITQSVHGTTRTG